MGIREEDVKRVRDSTDLIELIGEYTDLKRSGRNWMGLCTFHDERTPSMSVSPEGVYHCFGCQASGDSITFLREKLGLDFSDAVEMLAARIGYQLTYTSSSATEDSTNRKELKKVLEEAVEWYHEQLMSADSAKKARSYLRSRGYEREIIKKWKLGWAPTGYNNLSSALKADADLLLSAQLASPGDGGAPRDFFNQRIMFPIFNQSSEPVGFGGRLLPGFEGPKYLNSRDSRIYSKTRELYGLHKASKNIVAKKRAVVVEGYTDVIGMESAGILETVATCGTALTDEHLRILSRFSKNIVLAFDSDDAGSSAMVRSQNAIKALEDLEIEIRAAKLPPGKDPGDLAAEDPDELIRTLENPVPLLEFRLEAMFEGYALDTPEDKARASQEAGRIIMDYFSTSSKSTTSQLKAGYINYVAERTGISYKAIEADMALPQKRGFTEGGDRAGYESRAGNASHTDLKSSERQVLLWAVHKPDQLPVLIDSEAFFELESDREVFKVLLNSDTLQDALESIPESAAWLLQMLVASEPPEREINGLVAKLIYSSAERKFQDINTELSGIQANQTNQTDGSNLNDDLKSRKAELTKISVTLQDKLDKVLLNNLKLDSNEHSAGELLDWMKKQGLFPGG